MSDRSDKQRLLDDLGKAVAAIMDAGVAELSDEKKLSFAEALLSGAAEVRIVFVPSTSTVIAGMYSANRSVKPQEIFRIEGDLPTGGTH